MQSSRSTDGPRSVFEPLPWVRFGVKSGPTGMLHRVGRRFIGDRPAPWWNAVRPAFAGRRVLEIGGPSWRFGRGGFLPIYPEISERDNVDFSSRTVWRTSGYQALLPPSRPRLDGRELVGEATALDAVPTASYEGLLASHVLEHVANPRKALAEWMRVVRLGAPLAVIVPDPSSTFDHRRSVTSIAHLREDFEKGTTEGDSTHFPEILALHDLDLDPWTGLRERLAYRVANNLAMRTVHHHVFSLETLTELAGLSGLEILGTGRSGTDDLVVVARKLPAEAPAR